MKTDMELRKKTSVGEFALDDFSYTDADPRFKAKCYGVRLDHKVVGKIFADIGPGTAYPGKFHFSLNPVRWDGPLPPMHDPIGHDGSPVDTLEICFDEFVHRVCLLLQWRKEKA